MTFVPLQRPLQNPPCVGFSHGQDRSRNPLMAAVGTMLFAAGIPVLPGTAPWGSVGEGSAGALPVPRVDGSLGAPGSPEPGRTMAGQEALAMDRRMAGLTQI